MLRFTQHDIIVNVARDDNEVNVTQHDIKVNVAQNDILGFFVERCQQRADLGIFGCKTELRMIYYV